MTSFTNAKQKIDANDKDKRNTLVTIFLIIILLSIILFSVIIFKNFSFSSTNIKPSDKTYEMQFLELDKQTTDTASKEITPTEPVQTPETQTQTTTQPIPQTQTPVTPVTPPTTGQTPVQTKPVVTQPVPKTTTPVTQKTTAPTTKKISSSENKVGIDGTYVTSQNIKKYHDVLMKEFSSTTIMDYKIVWGDTLWKIALRYNTSAHTLYVLNALDNPDLIISGENLKVVKNFVLPKTKTKSIIEEQMKTSHLYNKNQYSVSIDFYSKNAILDNEFKLLSQLTLVQKV